MAEGEIRCSASVCVCGGGIGRRSVAGIEAYRHTYNATNSSRDRYSALSPGHGAHCRGGGEGSKVSDYLNRQTMCRYS